MLRLGPLTFLTTSASKGAKIRRVLPKRFYDSLEYFYGNRDPDHHLYSWDPKDSNYDLNVVEFDRRGGCIIPLRLLVDREGYLLVFVKEFSKIVHYY